MIWSCWFQLELLSLLLGHCTFPWQLWVSQVPTGEGVWIKGVHQQAAAPKNVLLPSVWKLLLRLAVLKELLNTVMTRKKKSHYKTPWFQSVINKSATLTFPPVPLKCSGFMSFQLQTLNVSAATRGRAERWWGWGCRILFAVGRSAGERLAGAWRLICLT